MRIIIPMAGRGSRLRPHTLTTPKPLIPIAGKPIAHRLVEDIVKVISTKVTEIAFIIHESFGKNVEQDLINIAKELGSEGKIYYQNEALGTAHAIMCAQESLKGGVVIAYADTLFRADFTLDTNADSVIWVKQVDDPSAFGVVQLDQNNRIIDFVEKPQNFVSDLAIIGIYYFKSGETLRAELQHLLDNNITKGGEYQLTDALENMKQKGMIFTPGKVDHWMDCGNKNVTVDTNNRILEFLKNDNLLTEPSCLSKNNATIIQPCFIGKNVTISNATVGPYVSIGDNCQVENSTITHSLIQNNNTIKNINLQNSMIGNQCKIDGNYTSVSLGDYSELN